MTLKIETLNLINYIKANVLFNNIGQCNDSKVKIVKDISRAKGYLHRRKYASLLTEFINYGHFVCCKDEKYANTLASEANERANEIGEKSDSIVDELMDRSSFLVDLDARSILSTHIDGIIAEIEYNQAIEKSPFRKYILPWYVSGHFPCGWDGEVSKQICDYEKWKLPNGRFVIL